jgi:translocation and assembly module TamB
MTYSPDEFRLQHAYARRGRSTAALDVWLQFDGAWSFTPGSKWSLTAQLDHAPLDEVQGFFETSYPVQGLVTGNFHGSGTRADPVLDGTFAVDNVEAKGFQFDRLSGQLRVRPDEIRVDSVQLRKDMSSITGNLLYRPQENELDFAVAGANFPLERIGAIQSASLPLAGLLDFDMRGHGPLRAPSAQGTVRLSDLRVGSEALGSFDGRLDSDGHHLHAAISSEMATGKLQGQLDLGLSGDYPLSGELTVEQLDLDPLLQAGLHLKALTGHSRVDGRFTVSGGLRKPDTLVVQADISHIVFDYEYVKLENAGPLRLTYSRSQVRIEAATLRGPDSDFHFSGYARFAGDRALNLDVAGAVNLRLLTGLFPALEARGSAQVNTAIRGTYASPRITGNVRVNDAGLNYGDFPAGLSHVSGVFVFNTSRILFENVSAEAGGGRLTLNGSVRYGDGPMRYDINANATHVRIRYPAGMSWLGSGTLQFGGTTQSAVLSGKIALEHVLMGEGVDLGTLIAASSGEGVRGPATSSSYLRNLQFDLDVTTSPGARVEWTGAHFETEGNLQVRGTWEHPVLLGNVHVLTGEMQFRGSKYQLGRGDINFANPFRVDPVLNVEATTTIQQYEITLDFTGPASHMSLAYRSDPPLPAGDIVALLALGSTGEQSALRSTPGGAGQSYGATAILSEAISSQLGGRIEHLFGISRFSVDPFLSGTATSQNAAARVTIEQQLTHELSVTYSTNASGQQEQVIQVEYAVSRDISVVALRDYNGTFDLSVKFKKHFK